LPKALEQTDVVNAYVRSLWRIAPESATSGD